MRTQTSNDVFYVTASKWKIWAYTALCWIIACIPLIPLLLFLSEFLSGNMESESDYSALLITCSLTFLFFATIPFIFLRRRNRPMAIITRDGFAGLKNLRELHFAWSPETIMYPVKGNTVLANPSIEQSYMSKLWGGQKAAVMVHNGFARESRQEVLDAIDRLSPFTVTRTTIWGMTKH